QKMRKTMTYKHQWQNGTDINLPVGKLVCIGRNYAAHAKELGNAVPDAPMLFLKPATALVPLHQPIHIPQGRGECHHETEICVLIGQTLSGHVTKEQVRQAVVGIGLGLDLTLRDVQQQLKQQGHPWEVAKAFDSAAPMGTFLPADKFTDWHAIEFELLVNGQCRQAGCSADMITSIEVMLEFIAGIFTLQPGDIVMTGTPEGVAALKPNDRLSLSLLSPVQATWECVVADA
ncbi:MAG: fumarylacetoacetate hydrolase family protein, partial [Moraxellaceae bacterium]|nr:fumarylacetoacetate hydrolase family protein [Moraxellaceae bacterium]